MTPNPLSQRRFTAGHLSAASEEARRRGDRRYGTDHILLALFEDPRSKLVGVSLQQARLALESLDRKPGALGWVSAPTHPIGDARRAEEARSETSRKRSLRITPAAKKCLNKRLSQPSQLYVTAQQVLARSSPPTTRSCGGIVRASA